jgi:hypothetical protein
MWFNARFEFPLPPFFEKTICQSWFRRALKLPAQESR